MNRDLDLRNETRRYQQDGGSSSSPRTRIHDLFSIHGNNCFSFYERNIVYGAKSTRPLCPLQSSEQESQHPPLIVAFPNKTSTENQASSLEDELLSPLPYDYHDAHHDKEEPPREYSCDERSKKKRQRWTQSEYSSFLQCLDTANDVIKIETTHETTPHTSNENVNAAADSQGNGNREFLSATLNFPYKEFISKNDKDHIKIWNDEEEQVRLERHFNPKWQVDFLSTFYGSEGSIRHESVVTPTNTESSPAASMQECSNKRVKYNEVDTTSSKSTRGRNTREVIFLDLVNHINDDSMENTKLPDKEDDTSSSSVSGPVDLQKAALNLCDAMDMSDLSRDYIARFERNTNFNRRDFLKLRFHFGLE
ncbi:predicted protein [Chaetoceros tenuissimus]|uniref:Uncharacterized protein n=1 Tax=Chaetoceros tenuissimus TaxID=426638 RepID=A0AAD3CG80_9STRA|nr:predicted protein [Chaetoceros tenuissimus]